jgi:SAM-dependent methyltransferase
MASALRRLAREILPPALARPLARLFPAGGADSARNAGGGAQTVAVPASAARLQPTTASELASWLAAVQAASRVSDDELRRAVAGFRYRLDAPLPSDPFSDEYRLAQMGLYERITGRRTYRAAENERSDFDVDAMAARPFPYSTLSCATVGDQLVMQGAVIRALDLAPGSRVLEFGAGWGNLTLHLAMMGHQMTVVDVSPEFIELVRRRAGGLGLRVDLACCDMLDFETALRFDAVVFYESFHHCADHLRMLRRLHDVVADEGVVLFGVEPITPQADEWGDYPWGIRLDGMSIWSAIRYGWLELGFTDAYFLEALRRTGWTGEITRLARTGGHAIVAARKSLGAKAPGSGATPEP